MATKKPTLKITVGGKSVDMDKLEEVAQLQATLLPDNWPIAKRDGVRLFLNTKEMLVQEFERHIAYNYKKIVGVALAQQASGDGAEVGVSFGFELNFSALTVAALGKTKMAFSQKFSSEGKPKTHDINQGDFFSDMGAALDTDSLAAEMAPEPEEPEEPKAGEEQGHGKKTRKGKKTEKNSADE
jgi:hypothetical protein